MNTERDYDLSVIIPVYNAEGYIRTALDGICKQTVFKKMEVLIIDDGSTDNSGKICREFERLYENVAVTKQKNAGVSEARNTGLKMAAGRYITFMDADDIVEKDLYQKMLELIVRNDADMAIVDFDMVYPDSIAKKHRPVMIKSWNSREEALKAFFSGYIGNNVVDKIFKREIAKKTSFPKNRRIGEDMFYVYKSLCQAGTVVMDTSVCGYHYVIRDNSAMKAGFTGKFLDTLELSKEMLTDLEKDEELREYAEAHFVHEQCKVLEYMYINKGIKKYRDVKKELLQDIQGYSLQKAKKYLTRRQFWGLSLMKLSPPVYMLFHKAMRIG